MKGGQRASRVALENLKEGQLRFQLAAKAADEVHHSCKKDELVWELLGVSLDLLPDLLLLCLRRGTQGREVLVALLPAQLEELRLVPGFLLTHASVTEHHQHVLQVTLRVSRALCGNQANRIERLASLRHAHLRERHQQSAVCQALRLWETDAVPKVQENRDGRVAANLAEEVAGVRVRVEQANLEQLARRRMQGPGAQSHAVNAVQCQLVHVCEAEAFAKLHHKSALRDPALHLLGNNDVNACGSKAQAHLAEVLRLVREVELAEHVRGPAVDHAPNVVPRLASEPNDQADDAFEGTQVSKHDILDALVLKLHGHLRALAVAEHATVNLPDAR
mmetsp:Transcript_9970/g.27865  ORF Transcript_9970/g.27865 Transcript_9970/m.27865 type:complete len:334 (+) Transcript_9970:104-1105(+)